MIETATSPVEQTSRLPADAPAARAAIERMRRRVRLVRAMTYALQASMLGAAFAVITMVLVKVGYVGDRAGRRMLLASALVPLLGALVGGVRKVPVLWAAQLLDRAFSLKDRLSNSVEFAQVQGTERTLWMDAAIEDADQHARAIDLDPRKALAFQWPAEAGYALALLAVLGVVSAIELRTRVLLPVPIAQGPRDPIELTEDDIDAFRQVAQQAADGAQTPEMRQAAERFREFVDQIAERRLDREEAFRRLQQLQQELEAGRESDRESLREALRELGRDLQNEEMTRALSRALQNADAQRAAQAMSDLARQLRENRMSQQQRQSLQNALRNAIERREREQQQLQQQIQRLREEIDRMLRQQRERNLSQSEQRMLRQRQRDLERLDRQQQQQQQRRRQLERLDRAMSRAMQELLRDLRQAAQAMEEGAQDLNRMQQEQLTEEQIRELRQQLEDLRQRMRQQNGQGGEQQRLRLQRFTQRARGLQPGGMQPGGQSARLGLLRLQRGGSGGQNPGPGPGQGQQNGGQGTEPGGQGYGTEHDEHHRGAATAALGHTRLVSVRGQQSGSGPTRSQVIRTAAQEGFTTAAYRRVHQEYWDHARSVIHAGDVPPGYRSYVRRYFQLIRPRDEQ